MPVNTHPLSKTAGDLFDAMTRRMGVTEASRWMFSGHALLDGVTPVQAIKAGRIEDVKRAMMMEQQQ